MDLGKFEPEVAERRLSKRGRKYSTLELPNSKKFRRLMDGTHDYDEICCELGITVEELNSTINKGFSREKSIP